MKYIIRVTFDKPRYGYWDGGMKDGGDFTPEAGWFTQYAVDKHPGCGKYIRWGCFELNFWFNSKSGRSWKEAASTAKKRLEHLRRHPMAISVVEVSDA